MPEAPTCDLCEALDAARALGFFQLVNPYHGDELIKIPSKVALADEAELQRNIAQAYRLDTSRVLAELNELRETMKEATVDCPECDGTGAVLSGVTYMGQSESVGCEECWGTGRIDERVVTLRARVAELEGSLP